LEELAASIFRVKEPLKMKAGYSSKTLVSTYETTQHAIPGDCDLNTKPHIKIH
jgi:hypothetical protein